MTLPRSQEPELLDEDGHDPEELAHSLGQVAQVNRWLGGIRSLEWRLVPLLARLRHRTLRVLDVGTGNGETLSEVVTWSRKRGADVEGYALDRSPACMRLAADRHPGRAVQGDALTLPFGDGVFDASMCILTLHHFPEDEAVRLLQEMRRVTRYLILVSDLERSQLHYLGARALAATVWRSNRLTRSDGPLSVRRSFTRPELLDLGRRAGIQKPVVTTHFPWRLLLAGRP